MITTVNGKNIDPFMFKAGDMTLSEVAHSLACQNRFFGHAAWPISIAVHAVNVSLLCEGTGFEMQALHHDDSEAVLGDINKWLKESTAFESYRDLESQIQFQFYKHFKCPVEMADCVKDADRLMVRAEMVHAFGEMWRALQANYQPPTVQEWQVLHRKVHLYPIQWPQAKEMYINRHKELERRNGR